MELLLLLLSLSLAKYQYVCELPWAASHQDRVENNTPLHTEAPPPQPTQFLFPSHPRHWGGKLQSRLLCLFSPASVNLLRSNQREIIVYAVHVFFSIPHLSSPLLSTIRRRHKIRRLLTASDRGCIQGVYIIFPHLRSRSCDNRLFTPQPFVTRQYAARVAHINLREE